MTPDRSNGYEAIAHTFATTRSTTIGTATIREWASGLKPGTDIFDIGCGNGVPISETLIQEGFNLYGIDASESLVQQFRHRFPDATVECNTVENSRFFDRQFDAVVSWGLMFLLSADDQRQLIAKVALALSTGGQFLFTSPHDACIWQDSLTGLESRSLGQAEYEKTFRENGLELMANPVDEGENYYYLARKVRELGVGSPAKRSRLKAQGSKLKAQSLKWPVLSVQVCNKS